MEAPAPESLSSEHTNVLITIERTCAGLSMAAITLTTISFVLFKKLRTTPNMFLLFASIANAGASVASMMGYDGLKQGENSSLCQAQAFMFEWCMQSDPWWSFAMSINVYLVFFHNVNPASFRKYAWIYCIVCFGGPCVPAIVLIAIRDDPKGPIFGDASLWCWIRPNWSLLRLYSYYIPIWVCILLSIFIYVAVGYRVFHHRNQLKHMALPRSDRCDKSSPTPPGVIDDGDSAKESLTKQPDFYGMAVTEVQITSDFCKNNQYELVDLPPAVYRHPTIPYDPSWTTRTDGEDSNLSPDAKGQHFEAMCTSNSRPYPKQNFLTRLRTIKSSASLKLKRLDPVKMGYLRTSSVFGLAVLITWIPSSVNRLYSLTHHGEVSYMWSIASGCVLPLQGVWNATIYFSTSWKIFQEEIRTVKMRFQGNAIDEFRRTTQLESRLDMLSQHRDTFERCRVRSFKATGQNQCTLDDIEMDGHSIAGGSSN